MQIGKLSGTSIHTILSFPTSPLPSSFNHHNYNIDRNTLSQFVLDQFRNQQQRTEVAEIV